MNAFLGLLFLMLPVQAYIAGLPASTRLVVNWWTPNDIAAIAAAQPDCGNTPVSKEPRFSAALLICPERNPHATPTPGMSQKCTEKERRTLTVDERAGTLTFEGVPPGLHVLQFQAGGVPPISQLIRVYPGEKSEVQAEAKWVTVYGTVTQGGKPLHVQVFDSAVTDPQTGRYTAALTRVPTANAMRVKRCDGSPDYWFVVDEPPRENAAFDIELPANRLDVDFYDAATGRPVRDVAANYAAVRDEKTGAANFSMPAGKSDASGRVTIAPVVAGRKVLICTRHDQYENLCSDSFTVKPDEQKQIRIALTRSQVREGRLLSPGRARVAWHDATGATEMVVTDEDGRFRYKRPHAEGEIVTVFSDVGFYAFLQPRLDEDQMFEIAFPSVRKRTFDVQLAKTSTERLGYFTLAVGDLMIPDHGFTQYLMSQREQAALQPGWKTTVANVFETGPIAVIFAPASFVFSSGPGWALRPEARSLPRRALGDQSSVTFD